LAKSRAIDLGAVWLTEQIVATSSDDLNRLALDRVRREIESGATDLDGAVLTLSGGHRPQPGEFGLELAGGAVLASLLPLAQRLLERYAQKLAEGAADSAASSTLELLKGLIRRDAKEDPDRLAREFEAALAAHGEAAGIDAPSAQRFLTLLRDRSKVAGLTSR
jgi:hypothetical protein